MVRAVLVQIIFRFIIVLALFAVSTARIHADTRYQRGPFTASEAPIAPEWTISKWIKGPETTLEDLQGQIVVIDFFQLWCPGCNHFSIPLMSHWEDVFSEEIKSQKLKLISIHTVFEGHDYQNNRRLEAYVKEKKMRHPVAVDLLPAGSRLPQTMIDYDTRGTPEMAIIDKNGRIRFQKLGSFDIEWATGFIRNLLEEAISG